jgi:hypothetical protein
MKKICQYRAERWFVFKERRGRIVTPCNRSHNAEDGRKGKQEWSAFIHTGS